ncbi:MAG TPA: ABC transporter ATP-binding protein [Candidatus Sulfotelmatobacter sp.]|nr:ABC transporter ATP-binding protein [Candidatus Sulfotelmatobacter sp.]
MEIELEGKSLAHQYGPGRGLEPLSFSLSGPGVVAVTGPNGSGKSTLLRILAGLLRPSAGASTLRVEGREFQRAERRQVTGWASPDLHFYGELTVRENLEFAAEARGLAGRSVAVRDVVGSVGLTSRLDDRAAALSTGMHQRLRLAFALLGSPPILLLDEPGSHLDAAGKGHLVEVLTRLRATTRVVLATNDPGERDLAEQSIALAGRGLGDTA